MQFKVIFTLLIWLEIKVKYPHALLVITGYFRAFTPTTVATKRNNNKICEICIKRVALIRLTRKSATPIHVSPCATVCVCVLFKALTMRSTVQIIYSSAIIFDCCNSKAAPALHVMHIENRSRETPNCPTVRPLCLRLVCSTLVCCLLAQAMACGCTLPLPFPHTHTSSATFSSSRRRRRARPLDTLTTRRCRWPKLMPAQPTKEEKRKEL